MSHLFNLPKSREPPGANLTAAPDPSISSKPDPSVSSKPYLRVSSKPYPSTSSKSYPSISSSKPDPPKHAQLRRFASKSSLVHGPVSVESSISQNSDMDNDTDSGEIRSRQPTKQDGSLQKNSIPASNAKTVPVNNIQSHPAKAPAPKPKPKATPKATNTAAVKRGSTSIKSSSSKTSKSKSINNNNQSTASSSVQKGSKQSGSKGRTPLQGKSPTSVIDYVIQEGYDEDDSVPFDERSTPWWQRDIPQQSIPWWQRDVASTTGGASSHYSVGASSVPKVIIQRNDVEQQQQTEALLEDIFEDEYNDVEWNDKNNNNDNQNNSQQQQLSQSYSDYESVASSVFKLISNGKNDPPVGEIYATASSPQKFVRKGDKMLRRKVMDPEPCMLPPLSGQRSSATSSAKPHQRDHHQHHDRANVKPAVMESYNSVLVAAAAASSAAHQKSTPDAEATTTNQPIEADRWVPPPSLQHQIHHAQVYQNRLEEVLKDPTVQHRIVIPTPEEVYQEMMQEKEIIRKLQETKTHSSTDYNDTTTRATAARPSPRRQVSFSEDMDSSSPASTSSEESEEVQIFSMHLTDANRQGLDEQSSSSSSSASSSDSSVDSHASESFHDEEDGRSESRGKAIEDEIAEKIENPGYANCWEALWGNICGIGLFCGCLGVWVVVLVLALSNWGDDFRNPSSDASTMAPTVAPAPVPTTAPPVTLSPGQQNADRLFGELPAFSQEAIRTNPGSPQGRAWRWLEEDDELDFPDERLMQRFALATIFYATDGDQWDFIGDIRWLSHDMSECMWYRAGIVCSSDNLVEVLYLPKHNLQGTLPPEIEMLSHLEEISLGTNPQLRGTIPTVIGSLTALQGLDLQQNDLTGSLPSEIGYLTELMWLTVASQRPESGVLSITRQADDAGSGKLSSTIPSQIGQLTKLRNLRMENNRFQGDLPTEMENLTELQTLVLSNNELTGSLPTSWSQMSRLQVLQLDSNDGITGTIPNRWGAEWGELQRLWLHDTSLEGSVTVTVCFLNTDPDYALDSLRVDCSEITCGCGCWCE